MDLQGRIQGADDCGDRPNRHLPGSAPVNPFNVNVFGDGCPVHQPRDTNVTAVEIKLTEKQENRG